MSDEQAQNAAPDASEAPASDVQNGAVNDMTPASDTPTPQTPVNEPLDIPPFDNSPTPLPQTPTPAQAPQVRSGHDLLVKARATIQQRKEKKLEKILSLFATKDKIANDEVEKLLHVSDATATRYLSELEKQGKVKQVGKTGHAVSYTRI